MVLAIEDPRETGKMEPKYQALDLILEMGWMLHRSSLKFRLGGMDPNLDLFSFNSLSRGSPINLAMLRKKDRVYTIWPCSLVIELHLRFILSASICYNCSLDYF